MDDFPGLVNAATARGPERTVAVAVVHRRGRQPSAPAQTEIAQEFRWRCDVLRLTVRQAAAPTGVSPSLI